MTNQTSVSCVGIVGAGAMGTGIAQVAAVGGLQVILYDATAGAASEAREKVAARLDRNASKGRMTADDAQAALARIHTGNRLADLAPCHLVIEAITEQLEVKRAVFQELETVVSRQTILATNTSSIPIGAIAASSSRPQQYAGMHFFNPVPLMRLVEIIPGPHTDPDIIQTLIDVGKTMGRTPVVVQDMPGFLVNHGGRAYTTEGMAIIHEKVATPAQVDAIMRDCFAFRMGPLELADLTGIDVNFPVTEIIHQGFFADPRLRSTPQHRYMLQTGQLGRKTGQGFYSYTDEAPRRPEADASSQHRPATKVYVPEPHEVLHGLIHDAQLQQADDDGQMPILVAPIGDDCSSTIVRLKLQKHAHRVVAIDPIGDTRQRITIMGAPGADPDILAAVVAAMSRARRVTHIDDSPGFVGQRMAAMVANLGCEMAQIGVATPEDIDRAMELGLNYPRGPLSLCNHLGVETTHQILVKMQQLTGDDRYRPSQWLRRRAQLGLSAHVPN